MKEVTITRLTRPEIVHSVVAMADLIDVNEIDWMTPMIE